MAGFVKGQVVVVPFPFSDLTQAKRCPALVIAGLEGIDLILCQITSRAVLDKYAIPINDSDFEGKGLRQASNIRPNRIFTADSRIVLYQIGSLKTEKFARIIDKVIEIIRE